MNKDNFEGRQYGYSRQRTKVEFNQRRFSVLPKRIAIKTMAVWILFVVFVTMTWQVAPALAGFTPTPITPTATDIPPTATPITPTATGFTPTAQPTAAATATATAGATATATAGATATVTATGGVTSTPQPSRAPENTPEMPVTGGQISGLSNNGLGVVSLFGIMMLLIVAIGLVNRQVGRTKTEL